MTMMPDFLEQNIGEQLYRDVFNRVGITVTYLVNNGGVFTESTGFLAVVKYFRPEELVGSIKQNDLKCYIIANDLDLLGILPKKGDKVRFRGLLYTVDTVDNATRSINANIICYVFVLKG